MNNAYILIITKEITDMRPEVQVSVYRNMESALSAYGVAVDEARAEAEERFEFPHEDSEISTDSYRYFRIEDLNDNEAITIEVQTKEIIGEEPDDFPLDLGVAK